MDEDEAIRAAREARDEMDAAIREYAEALWRMQDEESSDCVLGDVMVIAHFTPIDKMAKDNMGDVMPSPMYILLNPRNLAPHTMWGLLQAAGELIAEDQEITEGQMYDD